LATTRRGRDQLAALVSEALIEALYVVRRPPDRPLEHVSDLHLEYLIGRKADRVLDALGFEVLVHFGELFPRVGFIVTNLRRKSKNVVGFYNQRGTAEQWIKEGKNAIKWTRLSCRSYSANAVRLQLHALAYNLGNFLRTLATPAAIADWSLTSLREKLIKIGAKVVSHGRYVTFQMAEVAIPRKLFAAIMERIAALRGPPMATAT